MPVPSAISDLSQTAGSNYPTGSESPITADNYLRTYASFIALLRDGKGFTNPVTLASAATTDIGGQNSLFVEITGTTGISSFGTNYYGPRFLRFQGALTLTHNSTTLNIPGAANFATAAGDMMTVVPNQALNGWNVVQIQRAAGPAASAGANTDITSLAGLAARGLRFASGISIDVASAMPTTGTYTAGDIVLESTSSVRVSGWKRITTGSGNVLNTDWVYFSGLASGTTVATTSGTSIDFTGIPAGVKRITVMFVGVSTNGTNNYQIQVGAGSVVSSGYTSAVSQLNSSSMSTGSVSTGMAVTFSTTAAAALYSGSLVMTLVGSNTWSFTSSVGSSTGVAYVSSGTSPALGGALDRVRLTTVGGTDTFDAGSVNILYE